MGARERKSVGALKRRYLNNPRRADEVLSLTRRTLGEDIDLQVERGAGDW